MGLAVKGLNLGCCIGLDIGSRTSKGVIIREGAELAHEMVCSGFDYGSAADKLKRSLLIKTGLSPDDVLGILICGHSGDVFRVAESVSDIRCCARGIKKILPSVRTVIDIQGMRSQVIRIDPEGQVINFLTSEKCAAGSGRFLDTIANVLRIPIERMSELSLSSKSPVMFSTGCVVFGESEAISRVAEAAPMEDILAGAHAALANRIAALAERVGLETDCAVSGGGALNAALVKGLEERLSLSLRLPGEPQFINALGAALIAEEA